MTSNCAVHWMTCTFEINPKTKNKVQAILLSEQLDGSIGSEETSPSPNNYVKAIKTRYGKISWHPDHPEMRMCYNVTGGGLERFYKDGLHPTKWLRKIRELGGRVTRLDLALDYTEDASLEQVVERAKEYPGETLAKKITPYFTIDLEHPENSKVTTIYIGSRKSDRFICVYNKAYQMEENDKKITRIEMRCRKAKADILAGVAASQGIPTATRSVIQEFADFSVGWWQDAINGELTQLPPVGRKKTDTDKWLIETVAPLLERRLRETGGGQTELAKAFVDALIQGNEGVFRK